MRQVILDTETTGIDPKKGHRIIEIGCVEVIDRRITKNNYHQYIQPDREIDAEAIEVHGITNEFLADKPRFNEIVTEFMQFIEGAELVIHNAAFDVGFIDHELQQLQQGWKTVADYCTVMDTLALARQLHPGQKNNLDILCRRYSVDNSGRDLHGALLDAELLADVYLAMTGGQVSLLAEENNQTGQTIQTEIRRVTRAGALPLIQPNETEYQAHLEYLERINKASGGQCVWQQENQTKH